MQNYQINSFCRAWLKKLPDKGDKIQKLYDRVIEALTKKDEIEETESLLKNLNLESKDLENMEWEGGKITKKQPIDSDDDEDTDPLAILVSSNATQKKIIKKENSEKSLITEKDLEEAEEIRSLKLDPVLEHICDIEKLEHDYRFLPFKSTKAREKESPVKIRDNSAATPPVIKQGTVLLSLRESIEIENANQKAMKKAMEKHSAERLAARMKAYQEAGIEAPSVSSTSSNPLSMTKYRLPPEETQEMADSDDDSYESALSDDEEF